eukprot:8403698-Karenia_brevis.AAC.1
MGEIEGRGYRGRGACIRGASLKNGKNRWEDACIRALRLPGCVIWASLRIGKTGVGVLELK